MPVFYDMCRRIQAIGNIPYEYRNRIVLFIGTRDFKVIGSVDSAIDTFFLVDCS